MQELKHDDRFIINGLRCIVLTLIGHAAEEGKTVEEYFAAYPAQRQNDHRPCAIQPGVCLYGNKKAAAHENAKWAGVPMIVNGEIVMIEGREHKTQFKGNYSDPVVFDPL